MVKSHLLLSLPLALTVGCNDDGIDVADPAHDVETTGDVDPTDPDPADTEQPKWPDQPGAPPDTIDDFAAKLDHVELVQHFDGVHLVAYDVEDTEFGRIALERGGEEVDLRLVSHYPDGEGVVTVLGEKAAVSGSLPADVLAQRANAIVDVYAGQEQHGALKCAVTVASAVALCAPLAAGQAFGVATCPAGVILAWCGCAEVLGLDDGGLCEDF